jgi:hypothetical protein
LRASAAQTLVLFLAPLVMAMILLVPGQGDGVLGAELIAAGLSASLRLTRCVHQRRAERVELPAAPARRAAGAKASPLMGQSAPAPRDRRADVYWPR